METRDQYHKLFGHPQYIQCNPKESVYHTFNAPDNIKFVTYDGRREFVFRSDGSLDLSPANRGSSNFRSPIDDKTGHLVYDVIPYFLWGNSPDDPTTKLERIWKTKDLLKYYK